MKQIQAMFLRTYHNKIDQGDRIKRDIPDIHQAHDISDYHGNSESDDGRNTKMKSHQQKCHCKYRRFIRKRCNT